MTSSMNSMQDANSYHLKSVTENGKANNCKKLNDTQVLDTAINHLIKMPLEIIKIIFFYLPLKNQLNFRACCRLFNHPKLFSIDEKLNKIWKKAPIKELFKILDREGKLVQRLDLSLNERLDKNLIIKIITCCLNLMDFNLLHYRYKIEEEYLAYFNRFMHLEALSISVFCINNLDSFLSQLGTSCKNLKKISLVEGEYIEDKDLKALAKCKYLKEFELTQFDKIEGLFLAYISPCIQKIKLSFCRKLKDKNLIVFSRFKNLEKLNLSNNQCLTGLFLSYLSSNGQLFSSKITIDITECCCLDYVYLVEFARLNPRRITATKKEVFMLRHKKTQEALDDIRYKNNKHCRQYRREENQGIKNEIGIETYRL